MHAKYRALVIMTVIGTLRHFTATQQFGRFRNEADMSWQAKPAASVENDPMRTSCCYLAPTLRTSKVGIARA